MDNVAPVATSSPVRLRAPRRRRCRALPVTLFVMVSAGSCTLVLSVRLIFSASPPFSQLPHRRSLRLDCLTRAFGSTRLLTLPPSPGWGYNYVKRPANNESECAAISSQNWDWATWTSGNECYTINGPFSNGFIRQNSAWRIFRQAWTDSACNVGPGNCQLVYFKGRNCYGES